MTILPDLRTRLSLVFEPLRNTRSSEMPPIGYLATRLNDVASKTTSLRTISIPRNAAIAFSTAAVDAWTRAVHSFLISCAATSSSPIWASVSGYYSSHYTIRAFAHALGYFQLTQARKILYLDSIGSGQCKLVAKQAGDREHKLYWRLVKEHPHFASDLLFTKNVHASDYCDVAHRDRGQYLDHVGNIPNFQVFDKMALQRRITFISKIVFSTPPIPRVSHFPDVENVQVVAYHRLVRFRQLLDEAVGPKHRYWAVYRQPTWTQDFMNFQLTEQGGVVVPANHA